MHDVAERERARASERERERARERRTYKWNGDLVDPMITRSENQEWEWCFLFFLRETSVQ